MQQVDWNQACDQDGYKHDYHAYNLNEGGPMYGFHF